MRSKASKKLTRRSSFVFSDDARRQLVGGNFLSFKINNDECIIPSYLPASRSVQSSIVFNREIFNKTSSDHDLKGRLQYFQKWFLPMTSLVTQHMRHLDSMPDLKQQLSAMMHLLKIIQNLHDDEPINTATDLLSSIVKMCHGQQLLQRYMAKGQTIYYFPYLTERHGLINRNIALECFSLMLTCMIRQSDLRRSLIDELQSTDMALPKLVISKSETQYDVHNHIVFSHSKHEKNKQRVSPTSVAEPICLA